MPWLDRHMFPRLARSTLNQLQQNQPREGFVSMCACTEPVRTGIGAVCVEYGRPEWPITMLNHTHNHTNTHTYLVQNNVCLFVFFGTLCSYDPLWRGFFFLGKPRKKRLASLARLVIFIFVVFFYKPQCSEVTTGFIEEQQKKAKNVPCSRRARIATLPCMRDPRTYVLYALLNDNN